MNASDKYDLKSEIGNRIHDFRIQNHYTQAQFAELIDISVNFLSEIENGKKGMSQDTICRICSYFNISADYLLFGKELQPDNPHKLTETASLLTVEELELVIEYLIALKKLRDMGM